MSQATPPLHAEVRQQIAEIIYGVGEVPQNAFLADVEAICQAVADALLAKVQELRQDEHPTEDGVPVETYGYEATHNQALDAVTRVIGELGGRHGRQR